MLAPLILAATLLVRDATVIDPGAGSVHAHTDVLVDGERIAAVGPTGTLGKAGKVIEAGGQFVLPGFVDMHAHILIHARDEKGEIRPRYDREAVLEMLRTLLAFGVTTIRDPGSETEAALTFRQLAREGRIVSPEIVTAGRIINASNFDPEPFAPCLTADEVRREIRWQAAAGVDVIKIYSSVPPDLAKVAIDEAHALHLPIIGHLQRTTWTEAARLGIDGLEHPAPWSAAYVAAPFREAYQQDLFGRVFWLEHLDDAAIGEMIAELARHRVVVDPTLIAIHTKFYGNDKRWLESPDNALAPKVLREGWRNGSFTRGWTDAQYAEARKAWPKLAALIKRMHDGGVVMTVGTDTPTPWIVPGASVHEEMALLAEAGIPLMDVLRMATANAAAALHRDIGAVRPGARADLVVLAKDPLADIRNTRTIRTVIARGAVR